MKFSNANVVFHINYAIIGIYISSYINKQIFEYLPNFCRVFHFHIVWFLIHHQSLFLDKKGLMVGQISLYIYILYCIYIY